MDVENMLSARLKLIRQARGLSLDQLAERMDRFVTKQALSKYETDFAYPSPKVLVRIARALDIRTEDLVTGPSAKIEIIAYRTKKAVSQKEKVRLESLLTLKLEESVFVRSLFFGESDFELPLQGLPTSTLEDAESNALNLRRTWNLGQDPIGNVIEILEDHGVTVCVEDAEESFDGLSAIARRVDRSALGAAVLSRSGLTRQRQRLNVVHELAHLVMQVEKTVDQKTEESLAWRFAGAFLVPADALIRDVGSKRTMVGQPELLLLKRRYGVSMQAMVMRMHDLGIISAETKRRMFITFSKEGNRRAEPEDTMDCERPSWLKRHVYRAMSEGLLSASRAQELLKVDSPSGTEQGSSLRYLRSIAREERERLIATESSADVELDLEWLDAPLAGDDDQ